MRVPVSKKMDSKRRVVLPKDAVEALGLNKGDEVIFSVSNGKIVISKKKRIY